MNRGPRKLLSVTVTTNGNVDTAAIPDLDVFCDCLAAGFDDVFALATAE
jgi:hypothetical protein